MHRDSYDTSKVQRMGNVTNVFLLADFCQTLKHADNILKCPKPIIS